MQKIAVLEKQLPTAAASCFSTSLYSSATIFNLFSSLWWLKIHCFPLVFSMFLELGRFLLVSCEKGVKKRVPKVEIIVLGTAYHAAGYMSDIDRI